MTDSFEDRLKLMRHDLTSYGADIIGHVTLLHSQFQDERISLKNDPKLVVQLLQQDVLELVTECQQRTDYLDKYGEDVDKCKQLLDVLLSVSSVSELLASCDESINCSDLESSTRLLSTLKSKINELPTVNTEIGNGKVCVLLRRENIILQSRFHSRLKRLLRNCIHIEYGKISVVKRLKGAVRDEEFIIQTPIQLQSIWAALVDAGCHRECVESLVHELWAQLIRPLWKTKKVSYPRTFRNDDSAELAYDSLNKENIGSASIRQGSIGSGPDVGKGSVEDMSGPLGPCKMPFPQLLEHVGTVVGFVWSELFCSEEEVCDQAVSALQRAPVCLPARLCETLNDLLPRAEADLAMFQRQVEQPCNEFETRMAGYGFRMHGDGGGSGDGLGESPSVSLIEAVASLKSRLAKNKRREVLGQAREAVLSDYHNTMLASGDALEDDPASAGHIGDSTAAMDQSSSFSAQALRFEPCLVSLAAHRILRTVHGALSQACKSSPELARLLYHSARDSIDMFIALVPVKYADVIDTVPKMGAVFFNDCIYLAHNMTLLTHLFRSELAAVDETLQKCVGLLDFIPRFRQLGEGRLSRHMDDQVRSLDSLVARIHLRTSEDEDEGTIRGSLTALTVAPAGSRRAAVLSKGLQLVGQLGRRAVGGSVGVTEDVNDQEPKIRHMDSLMSENTVTYNSDEGATAVVQHLLRVSAQWKNVLQQSVYERVMGHLIEHVLRAVMKPILEADCISETSGAEVSRVMRTLQTSSKVLGSSGSDAQSVIASWDKFVAMSELLEYSLSEIAEQLPRRKFSSFTGDEMCSLLRALFEDTPRRQSVINAVMEMAS